MKIQSVLCLLPVAMMVAACVGAPEESEANVPEISAVPYEIQYFPPPGPNTCQIGRVCSADTDCGVVKNPYSSNPPWCLLGACTGGSTCGCLVYPLDWCGVE